MAGKSRGIIIFAFLFGGVGILFLLSGLGVSIGKWWPVFFAAIGIASFVRGLQEIGNVVFGLLLTGWSAAGILSLHSEDLSIPNGWLFFIGAFILWIPISWVLGRLLSTDTK
jgi:hypothetical protein